MLVIMDLNHSESLISKTETLHRHLGDIMSPSAKHPHITNASFKFKVLLLRGFLETRCVIPCALFAGWAPTGGYGGAHLDQKETPLHKYTHTIQDWGPSRSERNTSAQVHTHKTRLGPISISRNAPTELTKRVSTLQTSLPFLIIIYRFCLAP